MAMTSFLLQALHQDCNRVTIKPDIEEAEKTQDQTDQEASDWAWNSYLTREDSRIVQNFMGQVKRRVHCSQPECGRVSTTFDPFMVLSVPIPGAELRPISFTFVPLDSTLPPTKLAVELNRTSNIEGMLKVIIDVCATKTLDSDAARKIEDMTICKIWKNEIVTFLPLASKINAIREIDDIYVYQVRSASDVRIMEGKFRRDDGLQSPLLLDAKGRKKCELCTDFCSSQQRKRLDE
jgi:ubiquitin carboxyl-terminal hydrolase 4/11